jgi:N-acylethanolamine-hydrolysing acid amidase
LETVLGLHGYEHSFEPAFAHHNVTVFSRLPAETFKICGDAIAKHFPKYAAELQGLAAAFNRHDVTYNYLAAWVYFHEFGHVDFTDGSAQQKECTAILVQAQDGTVLHGRNMDQ